MRYLLIAVLLIPTLSAAKSEADYVREHCNGEIEYRLLDKTRVDCLTEDYAYEYDWCSKWAEAIGQSLHYARMACRKPAISIICDDTEQRFLARLIPLAQDLGIHLTIIKKDSL